MSCGFPGLKRVITAGCCALSMTCLVGCGTLFTSESSVSPWGKPVVVLASVSEPTGGARDLFPRTPFSLPEYPTDLLQAGAEGFVDVRLHVQPDGTVKSADLLKSTYPGLGPPVLSAVKTWQFPNLAQTVHSADAQPPAETELVCRVRFTIESYARDYGAGDSTQSSRKSSGGMAPITAPDRSHEMKGP